VPEKLSDSIEAYLQSHEVEPKFIFRLSARYAVTAVPVTLILSTIANYFDPLLSTVIFWTGVVLTVLLIERRRVCRMEVSTVGIRCYGLTGKPFLEVSRLSVEEVDAEEETSGRDFYFYAYGKPHRIPMFYEGFWRIVGILQEWAEENRRRVYVRS